MANKTIPQLNQVSAATDLDYLVITNSGETTTSKITRQDLLAGTDIAGGLVNGTGADSLKSADNLTTTAASAPQQYDIAIGNNARTTSGAGGIAIGKNAVAGGVIRKALAIGQDTSATGTGVAVGFDTDANGDGAVAVGLYNNASQESSIALGVLATSTGRWGGAIGRSSTSSAQKGFVIGWDNNITNGSATGGNGEGNAILAGYSNSISSTGQINTIVGGRSNQITGTTSGTTIIGLDNFDATSNDTLYLNKLYSVGRQIDSTDYQLLVNSEGSTITSTSTKQTIIGGDNNTIPATNSYNAVINGRNTDISGNSVQSTSIGGYNNDINGVWWGLTIGGDGNKLNGTANTYGASYSTILGGASNTITNDAYNNGNGIISSSSSDILGASTQTTIMGGQDNLIEDAERASIIGGQNHQVKGTNSSNKTTYSGIFVGFDNDILGTSANSAIIGGTSNTLSSKNNSVMAASSGRTALYDKTLHTDNIHIYGTESKSTLTGQTATGSVSVDLSVSSVFEFDITGNITDITFTNWREGGIYEFVVHNTGSYTITSSGVRLDGVANTIAAKAGSINPTNNGYTFYRMMIVNGKGWLNEHLNFQFM